MAEAPKNVPPTTDAARATTASQISKQVVPEQHVRPEASGSVTLAAENGSPAIDTPPLPATDPDAMNVITTDDLPVGEPYEEDLPRRFNKSNPVCPYCKGHLRAYRGENPHKVDSFHCMSCGRSMYQDGTLRTGDPVPMVNA